MKTIEEIEKSFDELCVNEHGYFMFCCEDSKHDHANDRALIKHFYREEIRKILSGLMMEEKDIEEAINREISRGNYKNEPNIADMEGYNDAVSELNTNIKKLLEGIEE